MGLRREGKIPTKADFFRKTSFELAPLRCWSHLSAEERRQKTLAMINGIEAQARAIREQTGMQPLGAERIRKQNLFATPINPVKPARENLIHSGGGGSALTWLSARSL